MPKKGRPLSPLAELQRNSQGFEFFQAVRLLQQEALCISRQDQNTKLLPVGYDHDPAQELVRFKVSAALKFMPSAIAAYDKTSTALPLQQLRVNFLGLYGPGGILPVHYSELINQRLHSKDTVLADFLDLFNHRLLSLLYRAWEKPRFYVAYERQRSKGGSDAFTQMLFALIGNGNLHLQNRLPLPDEALLFYAGLFARLPRSAIALAALLADYFAVQVEVAQFQGKWLTIAEADCTRLAAKTSAHGNQLGINTLLGRRAWDTQNYFKLKLGPLSYAEFQQFLPSGKKLQSLIALTRRYIGIALSFDVQLILKAPEVPACKLTGKINLGWNAWLNSKATTKDVADTLLRGA